MVLDARPNVPQISTDQTATLNAFRTTAVRAVTSPVTPMDSVSVNPTGWAPLVWPRQFHQSSIQSVSTIYWAMVVATMAAPVQTKAAAVLMATPASTAKHRWTTAWITSVQTMQPVWTASILTLVCVLLVTREHSVQCHWIPVRVSPVWMACAQFHKPPIQVTTAIVRMDGQESHATKYLTIGKLF